MKKCFFTMTFMLSLAFILSACGSGNEGSSSNDAETVSVGQSETGTSEGTGETVSEGEFRMFDDVRLRYLHVWNGGLVTPPDQYNNPFAETVRSRIGVTMEFEGIMMNEAERLNMMFASMDFPDVFNAPYWGGQGGETGVIKRAIADGLLLDLTPYLPMYPNIQRAYEIGVISQLFYERDIRDPSFPEGGTFLIPVQTPGSEQNITNWGYGVFVRGDVPEALGIDPAEIRTADELIEFMRAARDHGFVDVHGNPVQIIGTNFHDGWGLDDFLQPFSRQAATDPAFVQLPDGSVTHDWLTDRWVESHMFMWRLVNEGLYDVEAFRHTGSQADEKVGNGRALFTGAQFWTSINATRLTGMYNSNPEMRFVPVGPFDDIHGNPMVQYESFGRTGAPSLFIPYTDDEEKIHAILTYIDFLNTREGLALALYGIEGISFERNTQGHPRLVPELLEARASGADWGEMLRNMTGTGHINDKFLFADLRMEWFGEHEPGEADTAIPEMEVWRQRKPVVMRPGWPIDAFESEFDQIDEVRRAFFDGNPMRDFRERAYFAPTEAEARATLEAWQDFLRTQQNGLFMEYVEFIGAQVGRRDDIIF